MNAPAALGPLVKDALMFAGITGLPAVARPAATGDPV